VARLLGDDPESYAARAERIAEGGYLKLLADSQVSNP